MRHRQVRVLLIKAPKKIYYSSGEGYMTDYRDGGNSTPKNLYYSSRVDKGY